ncbi:MAG: Bax inhibitor-1 family protein [Bacilli bacterium]|nr:Bax inhibitor-1 family protein [Bacilli bacterium]
MAYASFHQNPNDPQTPIKQNDITSGGLSQGKALAKIYGYMAIALLVTGVVAFFTAWLFSSKINEWLAQGIAQGVTSPWSIALIAAWVVSLIGLLILSFVIPVNARKKGSGLWFPYILFSIFMGVLLSAILLTGVKFYIIAEAFGITALAFVGMFLIGWFTKKDISILAYIAMILGLGVLAVAIVGFITFLLHGMTADQWFWFDIGIEAAIIVVLLLITAVDTFRIKKIVANSGESNNIYLYCAYVMYCDFISILIRVIYILARTQGRN